MNLCTLFTKHLPFNNTTHLRRRPAILQDFQLSERGSRPSSTPRSIAFKRQDSESGDIVKEANLWHEFPQILHHSASTMPVGLKVAKNRLEICIMENLQQK
jgi:hypothetical protein